MVHFLGDAAGYLPGECQVVKQLRQASVQCIKANYDAMLLGDITLPSDREHVYRSGAARDRTSQGDLDFIMSWPDHRDVTIDGRHLLMIHGSPTDHLQGYVYPNDDHSCSDRLQCDVVFMGHTHYPFVSKPKRVIAVNVGSCGLPRDEGDLLAFTVYDSRAHECEIFRLGYDSQRTIELFGVDGMSGGGISAYAS